MMFQAALLVSIAIMLTGGATYYFNEEDPERQTLARIGLAVTFAGIILLFGTMVFLRHWPNG
jgi:hypothetical protein